MYIAISCLSRYYDNKIWQDITASALYNIKYYDDLSDVYLKYMELDDTQIKVIRMYMKVKKLKYIHYYIIITVP